MNSTSQAKAPRGLAAPDFPFSPKRFPFYYGWVIVAASTVGVVMSIPGQTMGVSVFTEHLMVALNLTSVQLSAAYMCGTILSSCLLPLGGNWFDHWGARNLVVPSALVLSLTLLLLSQCDRIAGFLTVGNSDTVRLVTTFTVIFIGFTMLRFSGQGLLTMTSRAMLGKWFNRKRGFVSGVHGTVVTFMFSIAPLALNHFVIAFEWRGAWVFLMGMSLGMALFGWLFFRDTPEECGLVMDGAVVDGDEDHQAKSHNVIKEFTRMEALRDYSFWVFTLGLASFTLIITAITFHIVSIAREAGLAEEQAFSIFMPMAVVSIICNFIFGWICDYVPLKVTLIFMMATMGMGILAIPIISSWAGWCLVFVGLGASGGVFAPLITVVWPEFYGREHIGAISSFNLSAMVFSSAIGPFLFSLSMDWYGSYNNAIYVSLVIPVLVSVAAMKANNPQDHLRKLNG
ncbi:MAG: MFS transporter [Candidatus Hinthialibacter antarcticus]|nr:MFS transporter [Candidatus Hinthialibacter antarcticus]